MFITTENASPVNIKTEKLVDQQPQASGSPSPNSNSEQPSTQSEIDANLTAILSATKNNSVQFSFFYLVFVNVLF